MASNCVWFASKQLHDERISSECQATFLKRYTKCNMKNIMEEMN